jgi:hypothetical protein
LCHWVWFWFAGSNNQRQPAQFKVIKNNKNKIKVTRGLQKFASQLQRGRYNTAMQMLGPPGMFASEFVVPSLPANAKRETNRETLERLELDLILIGDHQLSAADSYRLYGHDATDQGFWGCGVEAARLDDSSEILVLMRSDEEGTVDATLRWISLSKLYTRKQALLFYEVTDTEGPTEDAMYEILELFREVFEYAVEITVVAIGFNNHVVVTCGHKFCTFPLNTS